jgi:hypothetical protein
MDDREAGDLEISIALVSVGHLFGRALVERVSVNLDGDRPP